MKSVSIFKTQIINAIINLGQLFVLFIYSWFAFQALGTRINELDQRIGATPVVSSEAGDTDSAPTSQFIQDEVTDIYASTQTALLRYKVFFAINVVVCLFFAVFFTSIIKKSLRKISTSLSSQASETEHLAHSILRISDLLSSNSKELSHSIESSVLSIEEITSMTKSNLSKSDVALNKSKQNQGLLQDGFAEMSNMESAMKEIQNSSDEISAIIKTIDEIAFQTNILALNAAVEAARAGESGKGFAVVAEEVRTLAQRCSKAADDTTHKIQEAKQRSDHGASLSQAVSKTLQDILDASSEVNHLVEEIVSASNEQYSGIKHINDSINQMRLSLDSNKQQTQEITHTSNELSEQSGSLNRMVGRLEKLLDSRAAPQQDEPAQPVQLTTLKEKVKTPVQKSFHPISPKKKEAECSPKKEEPKPASIAAKIESPKIANITQAKDVVLTPAQDKDFEDF